MTLTEEKKRKFVDWLAIKTNINFYQCGICGGKDFGVLNDIVYLKAVEGGDMYPLVGIMCTNCKNIQTFEATDSGIMKPDEDTETPAIVCQECFKVEATMERRSDSVYVCSGCYNK